MAKILDLERFAALSAELEAGASLDALLAREGVAPEVWEESREEWLTKLGEETARKKTTLTDRYRTAFEARLAAAKARPEAAAPPPAAQPAPPRPAPSPPILSQPAVSPLAPPASVREPLSVPQPPSIAAPPPTVPSAPPAPEAPRRGPMLGSTVEAVLSPFAAKPLPFDARAPASQTLAPSRPAPPRKDTGTTALPAVAEPSPSAPEPRFSLDHFASFSAELSLDPAAAPAVRARWSLTEAEHRAEHQAWAARFQQDRALYARFLQMHEHYQRWLWSSRQGK
ncbi:MAG: hypothetical protein QM820_04425 [Minicystis sp.]